ncbi:MAG: hypothetical protein MUE69_04850 [Myxococcota bacterium]|jgi:hypothetical protein|nr:hypothetical protein [Myxococcota bacterium]
MSVEASRRIPWPWLLLTTGILALARYFFDETTTETSFRAGLGLVGVGSAWIVAKTVLVRPDDTARVHRAAEAAPAGERFSLPPSRFTLPPGSSAPAPLAPELPTAPVHPIAAAPVAPVVAVEAYLPLAASPGPHGVAATYVAPSVTPHTHAAPSAASFEDPDATWMVKAEDVPD